MDREREREREILIFRRKRIECVLAGRGLGGVWGAVYLHKRVIS
jgi:hypothetical protein